MGGPEVWQRAVRTCADCPILNQCRGLARLLTARGLVPRSMIWAGVGYDSYGRVIANLDLHRARDQTKAAAAKVRRKATVVRLEHAPVLSHHRAESPGRERHIVVGRRA